jgi:hypothetical protein
VHREYEPWKDVHLVIDTAGTTVEESVAAILTLTSQRS